MSETKAAAPEQSDATETHDDAQEQADFDSGFDTKAPPPRKDKPATSDKADPATDDARETPPAEPPPELAQLTAKDLAELKAAAAKTAFHEQQFAKAWGSLGNLHKLLNEQKRKLEIPKDAFRDLERDFPELAAQIRAGLEQSSYSNATGDSAAGVDPERYERLVSEKIAKREIEALEDAYPNWRDITGAVNAAQGEQPDPNNRFRSWLAGKDLDYQTRVNTSENAAVITRAIRTFQRETATQPKPVNGTPRDVARADRIRSAVQPRGDNAAVTGPDTEQNEFEAGFNASR